MKTRSGVLAGLLSVVAAALVIIAWCCLCTDTSEAACGTCDNCVANGANNKCVSGVQGQPACNTNQEDCNTCGCDWVDPDDLSKGCGCS
jgi:hypothetical protein